MVHVINKIRRPAGGETDHFYCLKIDQIEAGILTFEVPGSKWNLLIPLFSPRSSLFLPAGDMSGEIKW